MKQGALLPQSLYGASEAVNVTLHFTRIANKSFYRPADYTSSIMHRTLLKHNLSTNVSNNIHQYIMSRSVVDRLITTGSIYNTNNPVKLASAAAKQLGTAFSCHLTMTVKKGKGFPYSLPNIGPGADSSVQVVSLQVTISHPHGGRLPLFSARPAVTFPAAKLYCLMTEAHRCEQLAQGCYAAIAPSRT